jgi:hypothetical protein
LVYGASIACSAESIFYLKFDNSEYLVGKGYFFYDEIKLDIIMPKIVEKFI